MTGEEVKKKWPDFARKHNIQDSDCLYLAGDKLKILRNADYSNKYASFY